jgi:hypothetical protein
MSDRWWFKSFTGSGWDIRNKVDGPDTPEEVIAYLHRLGHRGLMRIRREAEEGRWSDNHVIDLDEKCIRDIS